jgi:elongator complex protein 1
MAFIEDHSLHKLGMELFQEDAAFYRSIMVSLGERLLEERKPEEAMTIFLLANPKCLDGSKRAARACGDWKTFFACCAEDSDALSGDQVTNIAEMISSKDGNMKKQSDALASAARILQDYCQDIGHSVDMLISGQMWSEGRRVAYLHNRQDLVKKCVDASVCYAQTMIDDMLDRASTFEKTNTRYAEVIELRRNAIKEAEEAGTEINDDSASMFSIQSTASNTSLGSSASGRSMRSVGSVGTVASVSTVISVGATSTFSFTGDVDTMKHKSKFNKIGRDKKKGKKMKNTRRRKPGGEEELTDLVTTLTQTCPDEDFSAVVSSTLAFLLQSGKRTMAELLLYAYKNLEAIILKSQNERLDQDRKKQEEMEKSIRMDGGIYLFVQHPCEKDIDALRCYPLKESLTEVFSFLL